MNSNIRAILALALSASLLAGVAGCGNDDSKPPDDKSYYTGPMKPKNAVAGPKTDSDAPQTPSGNNME